KRMSGSTTLVSEKKTSVGAGRTCPPCSSAYRPSAITSRTTTCWCRTRGAAVTMSSPSMISRRRRSLGKLARSAYVYVVFDCVAMSHPPWAEEPSRRVRQLPLTADAHVDLLHSPIGLELTARAFQGNSAVFEEVAAVGDLQCDPRELLDEEDSPVAGRELADDFHHSLHDRGGETERGFVEHQQLRLCHERSADGKHLLLSAGE